jgi:hypothetical protein
LVKSLLFLMLHVVFLLEPNFLFLLCYEWYCNFRLRRR